MTKTLLITGGSGLLALNWAISIRAEYKVVLGLHDRMVTLAGVDTRVINLEVVNQIKAMLEEIQPGTVVHTVAITDVDACESQPEFARQVNVGLAANVAKACADFDIPLVHISTDHLFAGDMPLLDEESIVHPVNVYGKTKAEAEQKVLELHPESLVIRTNFYGWGLIYRRSFSDFVIESLRSGSKIELFQDVFFTPILIEDLVQTTHHLLEKRNHGIFNLVGDDRLSKFDFGIKLANRFGLDASFIAPSSLCEKPQKVKRPYDLSLSNAKACKTLGRKLGGVGEHMAKLLQQEQSGLKQELKSILLN